MGYVKHNAIIVTGWGEHILKARNKAIEIFSKVFLDIENQDFNGERLISEICTGLSNGENSFFIAPDGSKEGWQTSEKGDIAREEFLKWMVETRNYCDFVEVRFGGDDKDSNIVNSN